MKKIFFISLFFVTNCSLYAQDSLQARYSIDYTTEIQSNFDKKYNWVNLLSLSAELPSEKMNKHWKNGSFIVEIISIYKRYEERIVDDRMVFSNIEEINVPVNLFLLGYTHRLGTVSLFGGLRNVNIDYFATPYTSLFTNSSAGIFPTLDANLTLANYPLSTVCMHLEYTPNENFLLKSSVYNGVAHDPRKNPLRSFIVHPRKDGIFSLSKLSYRQNKWCNGIYSLGISIHAFGKQSTSTLSFWTAIEQAVFDNDKKEIGFILHGGLAPLAENECRYYYATGCYFTGLLAKQKKDKLGIYFNEAGFSDLKERTVEITWQYQIIDLIAVQPTFHWIRTGRETRSVGLLRVLFSIGT